MCAWVFHAIWIMPQVIDAAAWPLPPGPDADETLECIICLTAVLQDQRAAGQLGRPNACRHVFCWDCIVRWAEAASRCPSCSTDFVALLRYNNASIIELRHIEATELDYDATANDAEIAQGMAEDDDPPLEAQSALPDSNLMIAPQFHSLSTKSRSVCMCVERPGVLL